MKNYVVITVYRAIAGTVAHAYGPYSKATAQRERRRILAECEPHARSRLHVAACKIIDIDTMNRKLWESAEPE